MQIKEKHNANPVGVGLNARPIERMNQNKGITLIALIITIIVMLILVGVTINVALKGGAFGKAEKASYQTNVSTIKERVALKKAEILADKNGKVQADYGITFDNLNLSSSLKEQFEDKLIISPSGKLYYDPTAVTNTEEQTWLTEIGITQYQFVKFKIRDIIGQARNTADGFIVIGLEDFWNSMPTEVSDEFKLNSGIEQTIQGMTMKTYNIICSSNPSIQVASGIEPPQTSSYFSFASMQSPDISSFGEGEIIMMGITIEGETIDDYTIDENSDFEFIITLPE